MESVMCDEDRLTSQQVAVRVVEMLRVGPQSAIQLAEGIGRSRRHVYRIIDNLSAQGGIAITNYEGRFCLLSAEEMSGLQRLLHNLEESVQATPKGSLIVTTGAMRRRDAVLLVRYLRRMIPPSSNVT